MVPRAPAPVMVLVAGGAIAVVALYAQTLQQHLRGGRIGGEDFERGLGMRVGLG